MKDEKAVQAPHAVIVLANLMDESGRLNAESTARAAKAVEAFQERGAGFLVTCGWPYRKDCRLAIADAFRDHILARFPVPADRILAERQSRDTVGDAYFTKVTFAKPKRWTHIVVVTSDYHVPRTRDVFEFIYGSEVKVEVVGAPVPHDASTLQSEARSSAAFRSTFEGVAPGDEAGILKALRERHPFYDGSVHPLI